MPEQMGLCSSTYYVLVCTGMCTDRFTGKVSINEWKSRTNGIMNTATNKVLLNWLICYLSLNLAVLHTEVQLSLLIKSDADLTMISLSNCKSKYLMLIGTPYMRKRFAFSSTETGQILFSPIHVTKLDKALVWDDYHKLNVMEFWWDCVTKI